MKKYENAKTVEVELKKIKEEIWKIEKNIGIRSDEFFLFNLIKTLEERLNVIETILKIDQDNI